MQIQICHSLLSVTIWLLEYDVDILLRIYLDLKRLEFLSVHHDLGGFVIEIKKVLEGFTVEFNTAHFDTGVLCQEAICFVLIKCFKNEINRPWNNSSMTRTLSITTHSIRLASPSLPISEYAYLLSINDWSDHVLYIMEDVSLLLVRAKHLIKLKSLRINSWRAQLLWQPRYTALHL